eukprot:258895-Chlamydomonas_euryale.AAC.1
MNTTVDMPAKPSTPAPPHTHTHAHTYTNSLPPLLPACPALSMRYSLCVVSSDDVNTTVGVPCSSSRSASSAAGFCEPGTTSFSSRSCRGRWYRWSSAEAAM